MTFSIGAGVKQALADAGDEARSDESFNNPVAGVSTTMGRDAVYYYVQEDNRVNRLPFER